MTSHALRSHPRISDHSRWLMVGFLAGAVAVLVFHQGAVGLLHSLGFSPRAPYSMQATAPWGIAQIWSTAFWGGLWGVALAFALRSWDGPALVANATLLGAILPTLVAWFIVA